MSVSWASLDLSNSQVLTVLLVPLDSFNVIEHQYAAGWDEFAKQVWRVVERHDGSTDGLQIHQFFKFDAVPNVMVLNSAMPVICNFLEKLIVLQPPVRLRDRKPGSAASRPLDEGDPDSRLSDAITEIRDYLRTWLAI